MAKVTVRDAMTPAPQSIRSDANVVEAARKVCYR